MIDGWKEINKQYINQAKSEFLEKLLLDRKEHLVTGLEVRILNEFCTFLYDSLVKQVEGDN